MQTGYISFCDKIGFNIKTQNVKENILKEIYNISNIKIIQKHFEILKHNHFNKLNDNPHLISLKSNGNPSGCPNIFPFNILIFPLIIVATGDPLKL